MLPEAEAFIAQLLVLPADIGVVVPVTTIVLPAHGSAGGVTVSGLLQEIKFIETIKNTTMDKLISNFLLISFVFFDIEKINEKVAR